MVARAVSPGGDSEWRQEPRNLVRKAERTAARRALLAADYGLAAAKAGVQRRRGELQAVQSADGATTEVLGQFDLECDGAAHEFTALAPAVAFAGGLEAGRRLAERSAWSGANGNVDTSTDEANDEDENALQNIENIEIAAASEESEGGCEFDGDDGGELAEGSSGGELDAKSQSELGSDFDVSEEACEPDGNDGGELSAGLSRGLGAKSECELQGDSDEDAEESDGMEGTDLGRFASMPGGEECGQARDMADAGAMACPARRGGRRGEALNAGARSRLARSQEEYTSGNYEHIVDVTTVQQCANLCTERPWCLGFNYKPVGGAPGFEEKTCQLVSQEHICKTDVTNLTMYTKGVYVCTPGEVCNPQLTREQCDAKVKLFGETLQNSDDEEGRAAKSRVIPRWACQHGVVSLLQGVWMFVPFSPY
ncbi:unnamed protein product [Prorocentrum cordatum]|uniref:Apple domain-containing protein n=1 Tax=Prorocentrum cordatum TaxID=2364126 RepID=A0ABN9WM58_9DINO|nr:unnamed protein product [Polarella glacialis]